MVGILLFVDPFLAISQNEIRIIPNECPENLSIGERGEISYLIHNDGPWTANITKIDINGSIEAKNSSASFRLAGDPDYPIILDARSSYDYKGSFSTTSSGFHYPEITVSYLTNRSNSVQKLTDSELCEIVVNPLESEGLFGTTIPELAFSILVFPVIAGIVGYFSKRSFEKRDFESQQKVQHANWLLQQINSIVSKYYVQLAKFSYDAYRNIDKASISQDDRDIKNAYYHISLFLAKYIEFERKFGANYLFVNRTKEQEAIENTRELWKSIPFDRQDINEIAGQINSDGDNIIDPSYLSVHFGYFSQWIKSNNCVRSRNDTKDKLWHLQLILDQEGERASQPTYFLDWEKTHSKGGTKKAQEDDKTLITHVSPKYVKRRGRIVIFGKGFTNYACEVWMGHYNITSNPQVKEIIPNPKTTDNEYIEVAIPESIDQGTYDVYIKLEKKQNKTKAKASVQEQVTDEIRTEAVAIHITNTNDEPRIYGGFINPT